MAPLPRTSDGNGMVINPPQSTPDDTQMVAIPLTYTGRDANSGIIAGIVLGAALGFAVVACVVLYMINTTTVETQNRGVYEEVKFRWNRPPSRHRGARPGTAPSTVRRSGSGGGHGGSRLMRVRPHIGGSRAAGARDGRGGRGSRRSKPPAHTNEPGSSGDESGSDQVEVFPGRDGEEQE